MGSYKENNSFKIVRSINKIPINSNFILSGMNLAFLGFYSKGDVYPYETLYHWPDGIFAKNLHAKIVKIPGRDIVNKITIPDTINKIIILGNCSSKSLNY